MLERRKLHCLSRTNKQTSTHTHIALQKRQHFFILANWLGPGWKRANAPTCLGLPGVRLDKGQRLLLPHRLRSLPSMIWQNCSLNPLLLLSAQIMSQSRLSLTFSSSVQCHDTRKSCKVKMSQNKPKGQAHHPTRPSFPIYANSQQRA